MPYTEQGTGYQGTDTSKAAAVSGAGRKVTLRDQVHELLKSSLLPLSSEEKENIYVVRGSNHGGLATYSNYKSALKHAKHFVGDALQVEKSSDRRRGMSTGLMTMVYGKLSNAVIEVYPLKEEFDNE